MNRKEPTREQLRLINELNESKIDEDVIEFIVEFERNAPHSLEELASALQNFKETIEEKNK